LQDDPGAEKAFFGGGTKYFEQVRNQSKVAFTVVFAATAAGLMLPPYVIYRSPNGTLYLPWCEGGPEGTIYTATASGWMTMEKFNDYFHKVILEYFKTLPEEDIKIVVGDNLACHLSPFVTELCDNNNIKFIFLPENSTHLMQPLDVAVFRPMKEKWRQLLRKEQYRYRNRSKTGCRYGYGTVTKGTGTMFFCYQYSLFCVVTNLQVLVHYSRLFS